MTFVGKGKFSGAVCAALLCVAALAPNVASAQLAQTGGEPVNLSVSGSASQPVIGVAPNGTMHVLWWDEIDGTRYARGVISDTISVWNKSVIVPAIVGERKTDENTKITTIRRPNRMQMLVDGRGVAHATWFDVEDKLLYSSQTGTGTNWSAPATLSSKAAAVAMTLDVSGTLQVAYVQTSSTPQSLAGVYYLNRAGNAFRRNLVYASTYFRTAQPEDISLALARDGANNVMVVWHAAREEQSVQTVSNDGGIKWLPPQPIAPRNQVFGLPVKVSVATTGNGQFLVLWRDASAPGCGLTQKRSTDAGTTWTPPERVMTTLARCPGLWSYVNIDNGALVLLGRPNLESGSADSAGTLAIWDGTTWAQPLDIEVAYKDNVTGNTRTLGCINLALLSGQLAMAGCDARDDVWAKGQRLDPQSLLLTSKSPWSRPVRLAGPTATGTTNGIVAAFDPQMNTTYAAWSQANAQGEVGTSLNLALYRNNQWSEPAEIVKAEKDLEVNAESALSQTDQPSLVVDRTGKLHLVWSGGPAGRVFYSSAFGRDAAIRSRWSIPLPLPAPGQTSSDPSVAADPQSDAVYVLYAVPFNEGRGVYLTRSNDAGATWLTQTLVFDAQTAGWNAVDSTQLMIDPATGAMHAMFVQAQLPGATGTRGLYYARSTDKGATWSIPVLADEGEIGPARLINLGNNALMAVWTKTSPNVIAAQAPLNAWWLLSTDGGLTWSRSQAIVGLDAISGGLGLASDDKGSVQAVALGRGAADETTLLYTQWQGGVWSPIEVTSLGEPAAQGNTAALIIDNASGQLIAGLRTAVLQPDGSRTFAAIGINRGTATTTPTIVPTAPPIRPAVTAAVSDVTPVATDVVLTPITPVPTVNVGDLNPTVPAGAPPNTLLISAVLAAVVVIVGAILASALIRRR
jgi:hypothetical protein